MGSVLRTRSLTAARNTDRTLTYRVLIEPGASPAASIDLIQTSTSERRICRIALSPNGTDRAASDIASTVPGAQTCRAGDSIKNAANVIWPDLGSAYVPVTTAAVTCWLEEQSRHPHPPRTPPRRRRRECDVVLMLVLFGSNLSGTTGAGSRLSRERHRLRSPRHRIPAGCVQARVRCCRSADVPPKIENAARFRIWSAKMWGSTGHGEEDKVVL